MNNYWLGPENVVLTTVWVDYGMLSQLTPRPQAMGRERGKAAHIVARALSGSGLTEVHVKVFPT